jgi:RNA polymerase sigma-70 factor (ECF subfamily)
MSFFDGLTHTMIAERLNLPLGTVKSRIRLACEKLRMAIQVDAK